MPTLLLPPRVTDDSVKLWRAAVAAGWSTHRLDRWRVDDVLRSIPPEEVAVYGGFFIALAEELGLALLEPPLDFLPTLGREFTQRSVRLTTLAEARRLTERAFYKPADDKTFIAKVYASGAELPAEDSLPGALPVLVSDIVHWHVEYRCFVLEGQVATLSPYLRAGERVETAEGMYPAPDDESAAAAFARRVLETHRGVLPPACVLDVGVMSSAEVGSPTWAVIEANPAWGAGTYGCDPAAVLPVIRRACRPLHGLSVSDQRWLTHRG